MRLFISYAHADVGQVKQVVEMLRQGGHDPWFDHKLLPGQDWQAELLAAITACDAFVYALTPDSLASEWCQWEFARAVEIGKPVIPVLLRKCTPPTEISRFQYADFSDGLDIHNVARLMGGLVHLAQFRVQLAPAAPEQPSGIPAQAVDTTVPTWMREELQRLDVSHILPPPFEWCEIPAGWVTLEDASTIGGTKGGKSHVRRFWMAKYPVTNAQYRVFENDEGGYVNPLWWDYSEESQDWRAENPAPRDTAFIGDILPRTSVCWYDAVAFCRWLTSKLHTSSVGTPFLASAALGYEISLPTEQQWQRAAQGDDGRVYAWGNEEPDKSRANFNYHVGQPTPVDKYSKGASPYKVMGMSGNVWEWCLTEWHTDNSNIFSDGVRVLRGGSCKDEEYFVRTAFRTRLIPTSYFPSCIGFRCVRSLSS